MPSYPPRCQPRIKTDFAIETGTINTGEANERDLICPAWACFNIADMLGLVMRGVNYTSPGSSGQTARGLVIEQLEADLAFIFDGTEDRDGVDNADVVVGLEVNRRDFIDNVVTPPAAPSTRTWTITLADGTAAAEPLQVTKFKWTYTGHPGLARAVLSIRIPSGRLE